jgi:taurine dioxygenase
MKFIPNNFPPFLGCIVDDINLAHPINSDDLTTLHNRFDQQHLLIIKNQKLSEEELINVSKLFGEPAPALVPTFRLKEYPLITKHSNAKDENETALGVVAPEHVFHADSYFTSNPNKATLFYSLKSPNTGGETHFVDMCAAYNTLSDKIKNLIADKRAIYKNAYINQPPVAHPLVRIHPITKKKALFVNIHRALGIEELQLDEALKLLKTLYNHAIQAERIYRHKWENGDLLIWSNVTTMHCATPIDNSQERLLYRILIKGDLPVT